MLTRLKVSGFKNLVDVDVRFGPFTCIAGANGTGKSNLFDAIRFLSFLADRSLQDAALSIRDEARRSGNVRNLFHRVGNRYDDRIFFEAEMIVPAEGEDELGQTAFATTTLLRYTLEVSYRQNAEQSSAGALEILKEELAPIPMRDASRHILFPHGPRTWRRSAVKATGLSKRQVPFISTWGEDSSRVIRLHKNGGGRGKPLPRLAANLPRTVLSAVNAAESPTATLARKEMLSWRLLQLEPSSLRKPDPFNAPTRLGGDGSNLAATLYHLARADGAGAGDGGGTGTESSVYAQIANRLSELIDDIRGVTIDRDEKRELLTLLATDRDDTPLPAVALSDGTLRFLALAVLELDPESTGVLCLEEPENGIHPERIPAMLRLLQDIATDPREPVGKQNPLRQVIINTHSPAVVGEVPDDSLLLAELAETLRGDERFKRVRFSALPGTWRQKAGASTIPKGKLLAYLNPHMPTGVDEEEPMATTERGKRRVIDHPDLQQFLPFASAQK